MFTFATPTAKTEPEMNPAKSSAQESPESGPLSATFEKVTIPKDEPEESRIVAYFADLREGISELFGLLRYTVEQCVDFIEFSTFKAVDLLKFFLALLPARYRPNARVHAPVKTED